MNKRISLTVAAVTAIVFAACAPGAARAWTSSNPPAPDTPSDYILGENSYQGASVDFGGTNVNRLSWYALDQVVTVTDRVWSNAPVAGMVTGWTYVDSRSWTVTLKPGYYLPGPKANIPVSTLRAMFYGADIVVTWKTTAGGLLATDTINYGSLSDYRCFSAYPECNVGLNKDGLGANLVFTGGF
jgi:hypothetical protein